MSMVDFSRGELSPTMRYRKDLEVYHKGVATLQRFLPTARGGLVRGPGCQVLELLPPSESAPAVRIFSLGSTGMGFDIPPVGTGETVTIEYGVDETLWPTYDTDFRIHPILKSQEIEMLLSFTEYNIDENTSTDDIVVYWTNTPTGRPAFYQRVWNYEDDTYKYPEIDFDDTRDVRIAQVENNVYLIARTQIYRIFWDKTKAIPQWDNVKEYDKRDVVLRLLDNVPKYFECVEDHAGGSDPFDIRFQQYWRPVYEPHISWEIISPRVGHEFLTGIGEDSDQYDWKANKAWASDTQYQKGDVVKPKTIAYECVNANITETVTVDSIPPTPDWEAYNIASRPVTKVPGESDVVSEDDTIYRRSSFAFREETVPREMVVHHNRLIFAGSSIRPSTIHGSEVYHYMNFGSGTNDDEPWIVTLSGDRVGRVLWMTVTDQLYIGTSGGIFAVSGVLTPNQFQLRKVTSHATSPVHAVAAAGSVIFFHQDGETLREVEYADQAENYRAFDLTIFSNHLFEEFKAVKMVVVNDPSIIIWILRADGTLVSLSYEKTVQMYAFARHEFHGFIFDIVAGKGNEIYAIMELASSAVNLGDTGIRQLIRIGETSIEYGDRMIKDIKLDGLVSFINTNDKNLFAIHIRNESIRGWYEANGITRINIMFNMTVAVDASGQGITGLIENCGLNHFDEIASLNLSNNNLEGTVDEGLANLMSKTTGSPVTFDISNNGIEFWTLSKVPSKWTNINLSGNSFGQGLLASIIQSVIDSVTDTPRTGTLDLSGTHSVAMGSGLDEALALKALGWTVVLTNAAGWDDEYIFFDGQGNTAGSPPSQVKCLLGETVTIPSVSAAFKKTGYEFSGWETVIGEGARYTGGSNYKKNLEGRIDLYAKWIGTNKISYNGNGSDGGLLPTDGTEYVPGRKITILGGTHTRTGHTFKGWTLDQAGITTLYVAGDQITMGSSSITLYSQWNINSYNVSFSMNGASKGSVPPTASKVYQSSYALPGPPTGIHIEVGSKHEKFIGWNTMADGKGTPMPAGYLYKIPAKDSTIFAQFGPYKVGDDGPNGGTIVWDYGNYDPKVMGFGLPYQLEKHGMAEYGPFLLAYPYRYMEVMKTNYATGHGWINAGGFVWKNNDVNWYMGPIPNLLEVFNSDNFPNKGTTKYWIGGSRSTGMWWWKKTYYSYIDPVAKINGETTSSGSAFNIRLMRGI